MSMVKIREACLSDIESLRQMDIALIDYDRGFDDTIDANWPFSEEAESYFYDRASQNDGIAFMAEVDGKIVGFLTAVIRESHSYRLIKKVAELESMYVDSAFRGQAIGEKLVQVFLAWAKSKNIKQLSVEASYGNFGAVKFYQKMGFIPYNIILESQLT